MSGSTTYSPGQLLGAGSHFQLIREIGSGGMGRIFLAHQKNLDRNVALKVLKPEVAQDTTFAKRFQREAKAAARFEHPNVVKVYEAGADAVTGASYIALEYLSGGSLEDRVLAAGQMPEAEVLDAALGVAHALAFASRGGIVHRDVKPDNILFDAQGNAKLADLGLAKILISDQTQTHLTESGTVVGTPYYMAPEQAMGEPIDTRADVYALGLCIWRCLTGEYPFSDEGSSTVEVLTRRLREVPHDVRDHAPHVSAATADLVAWATTIDVSDRCTADELVHALDEALQAVRPRAPTGRLRGSSRQQPSLAATGRGRAAATVGSDDVDVNAATMAMPSPAKASPAQASPDQTSARPSPASASAGHAAGPADAVGDLRRKLLLAIVLLLVLAVIELLALLLQG